MILKRLRHATTENHAALECQLPLLDPNLSREDYHEFVSRFYGYYAPLETQLLALPWWDEMGFDYNERYKTPKLERDLLALGDTPDMLARMPRCHNLPEIFTLSQLLGCLYVIEGSTLGGQIITRHLRSSLGITLETGCSFFNGYGDITMMQWQAFGSTLTSLAERTCSDEEIIATANQTFKTLESWLFPTSQKQPTEL
ncbi:MAG: biliverdin-producing heme oxygenase [Methylococcales bacterium]|nr:biliverdin-producing heme oxygenase [Methylococcaceae bacterium]